MHLLVTYAINRNKHDTSRYTSGTMTDTAVLAKVNVDTGEVYPLVKYTSPVENRHPELRVAFKSGYFHQENLYLPTSTEVLVLSTIDWKIQRVISHPQFNDLHHVLVYDEQILICNTGLDSVLSLSMSGELQEQYTLMHSKIYQRYPLDTDFRQVLSTKPHNVHPNYLFIDPHGELFVTCFFQRKAINLQNPHNAFAIEVGNPHDGFLYNGQIFFTTTNGHIVIFDALTREKIADYDLKKLWNKGDVLGWCRGICVVDDRLFVGFSKIRETQSKEFVRWIKNGFTTVASSRIVEVDLTTGARLQDIPLPDDSAPIFHLMPFSM